MLTRDHRAPLILAQEADVEEVEVPVVVVVCVVEDVPVVLAVSVEIALVVCCVIWLLALWEELPLAFSSFASDLELTVMSKSSRLLSKTSAGIGSNSEGGIPSKTSVKNPSFT